MATHRLLLLPGDGIGPEVMAEVKKLIAFMNAHGLGAFETEEALVGAEGAYFLIPPDAATTDPIARACGAGSRWPAGRYRGGKAGAG